MDDDRIEIREGVAVPRSELQFRASRAGGPGGQHVNTSSTRVELLWNVSTTSALSEEEKQRVRERLSNRIGADGVLRLVSGGTRSQFRNREEVTERFRRLLAAALDVPPPRRRTRIPPAAKEARLREKHRRSQLKRERGPIREE